MHSKETPRSAFNSKRIVQLQQRYVRYAGRLTDRVSKGMSNTWWAPC